MKCCSGSMTAAVLTTNIWGYLWAKLAYGAMLFATALTNKSMADCFASHAHRPLFTALAREILGVAGRAGIKPEPFDGFDPSAYSSDEGAQHSLDALEDHNRRSAKSHSGIWRDMAVRHRKTEADPQLGPIVTTAQRLGRRCADHRATDRDDDRLGSDAVGGVTDFLFVPLLIGAAAGWDRFAWTRGPAAWRGPVLMGLAMAVKQTPWLIVPFVVAGIVLESRRLRGWRPGPPRRPAVPGHRRRAPSWCRTCPTW